MGFGQRQKSSTPCFFQNRRPRLSFFNKKYNYYYYYWQFFPYFSDS